MEAGEPVNLAPQSHEGSIPSPPIMTTLMNEPVKIRRNSIWHFVYNAVVIFSASGAIAIMREWPHSPVAFWIGMGVLVVAWTAWRWMNYHPDEPHFTDDDGRP
jgi:hypothetical protein